MSFYTKYYKCDMYQFYCPRTGKRIKKCSFCGGMEYLDYMNKKGSCRRCVNKAKHILGF